MGTDNQYVSSFTDFFMSLTDIKQQHTCGTVQCLFTVYEAVGFAETQVVYSAMTQDNTHKYYKQHQAHIGNIMEENSRQTANCFGRYSAKPWSSYNSVDDRLHVSSLQKVLTKCTQQ